MRPKPRTSQRGASHKRPRRQKRTLLSCCKSCRIENVLKHMLRDLRDPVAHTQNPTEMLVSQNCQVHRRFQKTRNPIGEQPMKNELSKATAVRSDAQANPSQLKSTSHPATQTNHSHPTSGSEDSCKSAEINCTSPRQTHGTMPRWTRAQFETWRTRQIQRRITRALVRTVACPRCKASAGHQCVGYKGRLRISSHMQRVASALKLEPFTSTFYMMTCLLCVASALKLEPFTSRDES